MNLLNNQCAVKYKNYLYSVLLILLLFPLFIFLSCSHRSANLPDNQNTTEPTIEENNDIKEKVPYKVLWRFTVKEEFTSTSVISEGKVIFVGISRNPKMDNFVYAVDQKTGSLVWEHKLDTRPSDYIAESQSLVFVGCNEKLVALDTKTGNTKWEFSDDPEGYPYFTYPVIYDDTVIICKTNPVYVENKDCIFVLDALTGTMKWKKRIDGLLQSNLPVVANGLLYYGTNAPGQNGKIFAVDVLTGQERWHYQASTIWLDQPVANEQIVCFQPEGNELIALDALTGQEKWRFAPDKEHGYNQFNPSITNDMVYIAYPDDPNGSYLYGIDILTGKAKWCSSFDFMARYDAASTAYQNRVYISSYESVDKPFFAFDALTGDIKWEFISEGTVEKVSVIEGVIYISTQLENEGSVLYAIQDLSK